MRGSSVQYRSRKSSRCIGIATLVTCIITSVSISQETDVPIPEKLRNGMDKISATRWNTIIEISTNPLRTRGAANVNHLFRSLRPLIIEYSETMDARAREGMIVGNNVRGYVNRMSYIISAEINSRISAQRGIARVAELAEAGLRLSHGLSGDETIEGSMIAAQVYDRIAGSVEYGIGNAEIGQAAAVKLSEALDAFGDRDPFNYAENYHSSLSKDIDQMIRAVEAGDDEAVLNSVQAMRLDVSFVEDGVVDNVTALEDLAKAREYLNKVQTTMGLVDDDRATTDMKTLGEALAGGAYGDYAKSIPSGTGFLYMLHKSSDRVRRMKETLAALAKGMDGNAFANAAFLYLSAFEIVDGKLAKEDEIGLRAEDWIEYVKSNDESCERILGQVEGAIALIDLAVEIERCSFRRIEGLPMERFDELTLVPEDTIDMHLLCRLVLASVICLFDDGESEQAIVRLGAAIAMAKHLSYDDNLACSMIAHQMIIDVDSVFNERMISAENSKTMNERVSNVLDKFAMSDPFRYSKALEGVVSRLLSDGQRCSSVQELDDNPQIPTNRKIWGLVAADTYRNLERGDDKDRIDLGIAHERIMLDLKSKQVESKFVDDRVSLYMSLSELVVTRADVVNHVSNKCDIIEWMLGKDENVVSFTSVINRINKSRDDYERLSERIAALAEIHNRR